MLFISPNSLNRLWVGYLFFQTHPLTYYNNTTCPKIPTSCNLWGVNFQDMSQSQDTKAIVISPAWRVVTRNDRPPQKLSLSSIRKSGNEKNTRNWSYKGYLSTNQIKSIDIWRNERIKHSFIVRSMSAVGPSVSDLLQPRQSGDTNWDRFFFSLSNLSVPQGFHSWHPIRDINIVKNHEYITFQEAKCTRRV